MASEVSSERIFKLNDTTVFDRTTEKKISICSCDIQTILWKGFHFYYDSSRNGLEPIELSSSTNTHSVVVCDGNKPGSICIVQKVMDQQSKITKDGWKAHICASEFLILNKRNHATNRVEQYHYLIARPVERRISRDPITPFLVARFPVDDSFLSGVEKNLLNQVVSGVIDKSKEHDQLIQSNAKYKEIFEEKTSRVHLFSDGFVRLFDATESKMAKPILESSHDDGISLGGKPVRFNFKPSGRFEGLPFKSGAPNYCHHVFVMDDPETKGVTILIKESNRPGEPRARATKYYISIDAAMSAYQAKETPPVKFPYADLVAIEKDCGLEPTPNFVEQEADAI